MFVINQKSKIVICLLMFLLYAGSAFSQIDEKLIGDVRNTGMVHSPLPMDYSKAFETFGLTKKVLISDMLCDMEDISKWSHRGIGSISQTDERSISGQYSLRISSPTRSSVFPPQFGIGFGTARADMNVGGANWEKYNRIMFWIYPDIEGARSNLYVNLHLVNEGKIRMPDEWGREGIHEVNLINRQWNQCFLEISEFPRDMITRLSFAVETFGRELAMGESLQFDIDAIELQVIENPEVFSGWMPAPNRIVYSTTGYGIDSKKTAIVNVTNHDGTFKLLDYSNNQPVYEGKIISTTTPT